MKRVKIEILQAVNSFNCSFAYYGQLERSENGGKRNWGLVNVAR